MKFEFIVITIITLCLSCKLFISPKWMDKSNGLTQTTFTAKKVYWFTDSLETPIMKIDTTFSFYLEGNKKDSMWFVCKPLRSYRLQDSTELIINDLTKVIDRVVFNKGNTTFVYY